MGGVSTTSDLVKLGNAMLNNTFIDVKTITILTEPQKLANGKVNGINYVLVWRNDTARIFKDGLKVQQIPIGITDYFPLGILHYEVYEIPSWTTVFQILVAPILI